MPVKVFKKTIFGFKEISGNEPYPEKSEVRMPFNEYCALLAEKNKP